MYPKLKFSLEMVDGDRLGRLAVPLPQIAEWINFLASPHYGATILFAEQNLEGIILYFEGCEGLYAYLSDRIPAEAPTCNLEPVRLALAG